MKTFVLQCVRCARVCATTTTSRLFSLSFNLQRIRAHTTFVIFLLFFFPKAPDLFSRRLPPAALPFLSLLILFSESHYAAEFASCRKPKIFFLVSTSHPSATDS